MTYTPYDSYEQKFCDFNTNIWFVPDQIFGNSISYISYLPLTFDYSIIHRL